MFGGIQVNYIGCSLQTDGYNCPIWAFVLCDYVVKNRALGPPQHAPDQRDLDLPGGISAKRAELSEALYPQRVRHQARNVLA